MKGVSLLAVVVSVFLVGCGGKSPEEHLAEANYCEGYAREEINRAVGTAPTYRESHVYRVLYDTCMNKQVGERHFD